jgi:fibronectin type 3 domain-containing protein
LEGNGVKPAAPGKPAWKLSASSITVSWEEVAMAESYHLYYGTSPALPKKAAYSGGETTLDISDFVNGTAYYAWVCAENERGSSPFSEAGIITPVLPAAEPVVPGGDRSITVSWEPVSLAASYNLYYAESNTPPTSPWQSGITETAPVTITGLVNETAYYVWIESVNAGGTTMSNAVYVATSPLPEPGEPVLQGGNGSITVSWEPVPLADFYNVYYSTDLNSKGNPYLSGVTEPAPVTITGLANDTVYYVWVEAVNTGGTKMSAAKSLALVLSAPVPVITQTKGSVAVSWEKIEYADSYNVYCGTNQNVTGSPYRSGLIETSVTITGLSNGTNYYLWVEAVNTGGTTMSMVKSVTTLVLPAPVPVVTLGEGSITVSWGKIELADSYNLYYSTDQNAKGSPYRSGVTGTAPVTITGLVNGTTYYVWVEAVNVGGTKMSAVKGVTTMAAPVPAVMPGKSSITVSWEKIEYADSYNVYYAGSETLPGSPHQSGVTETSVTITGLANGSAYYVWVEAVNTGGSRMSAAKSVTTLALPAPVPVVTPEVGGGITVSWAPVALADSYNLYYSLGQTRPVSPYQSHITGTTPVTITGLAKDTTYYVWVEAVNTGGTTMSEAISGKSGGTVLSGHDYTVNSEPAFTKAINAIKASSTTGNYRITLTGSITAGNVSFSASPGKEKTITIQGDTIPRTITNTGNADLFTITTGVTLVLGNNIKLDGNGKLYSVVRVNEGNLVMKAGSVMSGAKTDAVYASNGTFTMEGGMISGNTGSSGGGVYFSGGDFRMSGGTISGNTGSSGGGVYFSGGDYKMSGGTISGNTAYSGGGVYVHYGDFRMSGGTISGNTDRGGVFLAGGTFTMESGVISGNTDGGVYVSSGDLRMSGGTISGNTDRGGVFLAGGTFTMEGGEISENTASSSSSGGVYVSGGTFTMKNGKISENTASSSFSGGGVYVASGGTFTMEGGEISENTASSSSSGGGVHIAGGTFTMEDGEINGNRNSSLGGGVYIRSGTFTMKKGKISENTASSGGGVYVAGGTFTMDGGGVSKNTASSSSSGGGVYISGGIFTMKNGEISENTASFGGGVHVVGGTFTMDGGGVSKNTASEYGGGVYFSYGTFTMSSGTINGNTAHFGGGVYINREFRMAGGTISGNTASSDGGGVYAASGIFTMSSGTISGNTASSDGGGVYAGGGTFTMSSGTISGNTASSGKGGGVYVPIGSFVKTGGGTIDATNSAVSGRVVYVSSDKQRNTTAGSSVNMNSNISGSAGGWE